MAGNTKEERDFCIAHFPDLEFDGSFEVNSDPNYFYNCIGFAIGYEDVWIAPSPRKSIPWFWWPDSVPFDEDPNSLVATFQYFGFELCDNDSLEDGFEKVALYSKNDNWKHAARIIGENIYHSKLGECYDIYHRGGNVLEKASNPNESYGEPYMFMKRRLQERDSILNAKKPPFGYMTFEGNTFYYMAPSPLRGETIRRIMSHDFDLNISKS